MRKFLVLYILGGVLPLFGTPPPPSWWLQQGVTNGAPTADYGAANIGQAKWIANRALAEIRNTLPALATQIEGDLVGAGKPIPSWASSTDDAVLLTGQLKAISAPFYQRINASAPVWLQNEMTAYGTRVTGTYLPWSAASGDDSDMAIANLGQLKAVFSLRFSDSFDGDEVPDLFEYYYTGGTTGMIPPAYDTDHNGMPDAWEIDWFHSTGQDPGGDPDLDGLTNLEEFLHAQNPTSAAMPAGPGVEAFTYDDDGRLTQVSGPVPRVYTLDAAGNIQSQN